MGLTRRSLLQLIGVAPAFGLIGASLAQLESLAASAPADSVDDAAGYVGSTVEGEGGLGFVQNGGKLFPIKTVTIENRRDWFDTTCLDDTFSRGVMSFDDRHARVVLRGIHHYDDSASKFEIRLMGLNLRFGGWVEAVRHNWVDRDPKDRHWESEMELRMDANVPTEFEYLS